MLISCGKKKSDNVIIGLTIDKNIKTEVEKHISKSKEFDTLNNNNKMQVYDNSVFAESYENDSLYYNSYNYNPYNKIHIDKQVFESFYHLEGDTLKIEGAFGIYGGRGFVININKNNATLYHLLSSGSRPTYAYKEKDSLIFRLEVPCTETRIVLSEIPDSAKKQIIYGYVEFKSRNYYATISEVNLRRNKQRDNMKIYFKSSLGL
jgi:hypothetical protein